MKVAVVTPYHQTPRPWLKQCLASVAKQTVPCRHFLVCDGDEPPVDISLTDVEIWPALAARGFWQRGTRHRLGLGNRAWVRRHLLFGRRQLVRARPCRTIVRGPPAERSRYLHLPATLHDLRGEVLGLCQEVDGDIFVDTNCLFLTRRAFGLVAAWYLMPRSQVELGDRFVWKAIRDAKLKPAHLAKATVNYRTRHRAHYLQFGKEPPPEA